MTILELRTPVAGWCLSLSEVPDPVFAERMAGDGVAIDPTGDLLHAPCDGVVVPMRGTHAVTLRTALGLDILMHVGIDTVQMDGRGFDMLVTPGQRVRAGDPLLRFDLDLVARHARSVVTPVLVATGNVEGVVVRRAAHRTLAVGDFLMEIRVGVTQSRTEGETEAGAPTTAAQTPMAEARGTFTVPFDHGIHARPAAQLATALRPFAADVALLSRGRSANLRSAVAVMTLGVHAGETVEVRAVGPDADQALAAVGALLTEPAAPTPVLPAGRPPRPRPSRASEVDSTVNGRRRRYDAVIAARGVGAGRAVQLIPPEVSIAPSSGDPAREASALSAAIATVTRYLGTLAASAAAEQRTVIDAHTELVQDPELARQADDAIRGGAGAGAAWSRATRATIDALTALGDARMVERASDLRDLENQVLRVLAGQEPGTVRHDLPERAVVVADDMLPSVFVSLDRTRIAGIVTARGGPTSHAAILAASAGIPMLVAAGGEILEIADGTPVVVDAARGHVDVDPPAAEWDAVQRSIADRAAQDASDRTAASRPAQTTDGVRVAVYANVGSAEEAEAAAPLGAEGSGLVRTEFLFLDRRDAPDEEEQLRVYQRIAAALAGRPVAIRTLDIGGDKPIPYLPLPREDNPALGLRGLRTSLWRPDLLRTQLRAMLRVRPADQVRVLLPMVTDLDDVRAARAVLEEERASLGVAAAPKLGVMIETPASALLADQLVREVDFLSVGTNDLSQYALALDRGHAELAPRLDGLHPAVLRLIATASAAAAAAGREIAVCGGLGSDPEAIPILLGLGIRELSVVAGAVPRVKRIVRGLSEAACRALATDALAQTSAHDVRTLVRARTSGT